MLFQEDDGRAAALPDEAEDRTAAFCRRERAHELSSGRLRLNVGRRRRWRRTFFLTKAVALLVICLKNKGRKKVG